MNKMSTRRQRLEYVSRHRDTYESFLVEVASSPFSDIDKMEFAAISANTQMDGAIKGFVASRGLDNVDAIGEALHFWGVNAPYVKAAYCMGIREIDESLIPNPDVNMLEQRRYSVPQIKVLGYAKYSFAASLIHPFESDIVCVDTHMYQTYTGKVPTGKDLYGRTQKCYKLYENIENVIRVEAKMLGVSPFLYQWAVWDMQRGEFESHDFLWQDGSVRIAKEVGLAA